MDQDVSEKVHSFCLDVHCSALKAHVEAFFSVFQKLQIAHFLDGNAKIPAKIEWEEEPGVCGCLSLYCFAPVRKGLDFSRFLYEMVSRWIISGQSAAVLSYRHHTFKRKKSLGSYFVAQMLLQVKKGFQKSQHIKTEMPLLVSELLLGMKQPDYAKHLLETSCGTTDQMTHLIYQNLLELKKRNIKAIESDIYAKAQRFLLQCPQEFKELRSVRHICRLICSFYLFHKKLRRQRALLSKGRQLHFKLMNVRLNYPFGAKDVLAFLVCLSFSRDYEHFEERHMVAAIRRFLPDVLPVPGSFCCFPCHDDPRSFCFYLELEKPDGKKFSLQEKKLLQSALGREVSDSVERLMPAVFMPRNEEEVMRNILTLTRELKYVRDLPQVIISFSHQTELALTFHIVLLRVLKAADRSLSELFCGLQMAAFSLEQTKNVGQLRKRYPKEANVFTLSFHKDAFMRRDHSVDLFKARDFVVKVLQSKMGEVRDYNGGLIVKQNQTLSAVKARSFFESLDEEDSLERLFYALSPVIMQSLLSPCLVEGLFKLFREVLQCGNFGKEKYNLAVRHMDSHLLLMLRLEDETLFPQLLERAKALVEEELQLATTSFSQSDAYFVGYIYHNDDSCARNHFVAAIEQVLMSNSNRPKEEPTLRLSLSAPPSSLHPLIGFDHASELVMRMLYEGLMRFDAKGCLTHGVAEHVGLSEDRRTYTFTLRKAYWSNGMRITAGDFEYAWKKMLDPQLKMPFVFLFFIISNAREIWDGKLSMDYLGVYARNEQTLVVRLHEPAPYFLELTTNWLYAPLCREVDQTRPGWAHYAGENYVCNGPFKLAEWRRQESIKLAGNPQYWDAASVALHVIDISLEKDPKQCVDLFAQDALDFVGEPLQEISLGLWKPLKGKWEMESLPVPAVYELEFNTKQTPFQSKKMRQALCYAICRKALVEEVFHGLMQPALSLFPPSMALQSAPFFEDGNVSLARTLFHEALQELQLTLEDLPPFVLLYVESPQKRAVNETIKRQLKETLGIEIHLEGLSWNDYFDRLARRDFQIAGSTWYSWINDPIYTLDGFKSLKNLMNASQWHDPRYKRLLNDAGQCLDAAERKSYLAKAEQMLMRQLPVAPIYFYSFCFLKSQRLNGLAFSPTGMIDFKWTKINSP